MRYLIFCLLLFSGSACKDVISDPVSRSNYLIDNRTSYDLIFQTPDIAVDVLMGTTTEIYTQYGFGLDGTPPEDAFGELIDDLGTVYLHRDSSGVAIEALALSPNPDLIWEEVSLGVVEGEHTNQYTLIVTDSMID